MKIAYIANLRLPTEKAHGFQIMKMCEALAQRGLDLELIVPKRFNGITEDPFDYWNIERIFSVKTIGIIDFMSFRFLPRFGAFLLEALNFSIAAFFYVNNRKSDFSYLYTRDREIVWLSSFLKIPIIFEVHFLARPLFIYKPFLRRLFKIATITEFMRDFLVKAGIDSEKIIVLPDAVDLKQFDFKETKNELRKNLGIPLDKKIVLYAGQLYYWKGVNTLIEAARHLTGDFMVIIVGGNSDDINRLKKIAGDNIFFTGQKKNMEIPFWLRSADFLVLPNSGKLNISKYYTSPLKLFEYMASGVPIISSDLPSLREILNDNEALFFEPDNSEDLARNIIYFSKNILLSKKLSQNALNKVKEYTWSKRAAAITSEI